MKRAVLKIIVLLAVFVGGVFGFSELMNQETMESSREMENPTLPVLCIDKNGYKINQMFGYTQEMDQTTIRDGIVPLTTNREISVSCNDFGNSIDSVSYEVTNLMNGTVVENAKVGNFKEDGEYRTATFSLQEPILMGQEYGLKFTVNTGEKEVYYYTRLVQRASLSTDQYVEFAYSFYEKCMNRDGANGLNAYLETSESVVNNSYTNISINATFNQVTWGDLKPQIYRKPVARIKEINENTGSIVLEYMISSQDESGNTELYYVTDFFRMRYFQSEVMLLDFYRNAQQVFSGDPPGISAKGIELGIASKTVSYKTNTNANIVAFVQAGELWSYNDSADKLVQIFSMRNKEDGDVRDDHRENDIKIIRVEESGDVDFVVYGYFNRDIHEGKSGVAVYHYSSERNTVEEKVFLPSAESYEYLNEDLKELCYVNQNDHLYLYLNSTIYMVNLDDMTWEAVLDQVNPDCLIASKNQNQIAWMDEMKEYASSHITLMDLDKEETRKIGAGDGQKLKVLGFINEDFIYGIARDEDIISDVAGNTTFAISRMKIENFAGKLIKDYQVSGVWISNVNIKEGLIELERVVWSGSEYVETTTDNIMNNQQNNDAAVEIRATDSSRKGTVITLVFPKAISSLKPLYASAKIRITEEMRTVELNQQETEYNPEYYVYAKGKLAGIYSKPSEAVVYADSQVGVVLNRRQQYVWERGNNATEKDLNNADIPEVVLSGTLDEQAIQESLGDSAEVMNLTGCTLEEILYQLSSDRPVIARQPDGTAAVIVGYDRYNTRLYKFDTGEHYYYAMDDSTALFEQGGNVFISYVEIPKTGGE